MHISHAMQLLAAFFDGAIVGAAFLSIALDLADYDLDRTARASDLANGGPDA